MGAAVRLVPRDLSIQVVEPTTADGVKLKLTRHYRGRCDKVVILSHGLTSSGEMFTMPEHVNLVDYLLENGFTDVWTLDWRGSTALPHYRSEQRWNLDDVALYDLPAALRCVRERVGAGPSLHMVAHCLGSLSLGMALAAGRVPDLASAICHAVFLMPRPAPVTAMKILALTDLLPKLLGQSYVPFDLSEVGLRSRAALLFAVAAATRSACRDSTCQLLSFIYGGDESSVFRHENLDPRTHARLKDLFGPLPLSYVEHVRKMMIAGRAVKLAPGDARYRALPDDYLAEAHRIETPVLLLGGDRNGMWGDSNALCHELLARQCGRDRIHFRSLPGYGHQDVFIGKAAALDVFPHIVSFLEERADPPLRPHPPPPSPTDTQRCL